MTKLEVLVYLFIYLFWNDVVASLGAAATQIAIRLPTLHWELPALTVREKSPYEPCQAMF